MKVKKAIYPGSFDPLHQGHIQILKKALLLFDKVYVIVTNNPDKENQSDINQRFSNTKKQLANFENVEVLMNENEFTAVFAKQLNANFIIRSARDNHDFNYELELAAGNKHLNSKLETILIIPNYKSVKYSSTLIRHKERLNK
ncbi:pantetheine-phosphate adenylyltransferase [Mycoplasmopsis citelli]|uniref:Phosphopantetheine adenylyltransferase n=1 Tax=Mycoplasmopsis citelli TaxID=171281 RepID=A0A449B1Y2_9BACT|nr:pantetheine-phosphate adenylyltransferase [Mycoplasmopsis citelli]UUD36039.1 pantetheine-phosphate adenylyltransferase [Mycoplasmopsis citelli]VEU74583.1 phosphopantetheine adenylyltransferase [Mycoplasmopsis citelli]